MNTRPTDLRISAPAFVAAGNTTFDAALRKFRYDAENKQTKVESTDAYQTVTGTVGEYSYDGDGKRVKKNVPATGETTIFVYDASGKQIAEYSTIVADTSTAKVNYLTNDHLGSPRINTDASGTVTARHDYHPFGEEIYSTQRTTGLGYDADTVRKQFTGYERDTETNLDYAKARMFGSGFGRFTSPDPLMASAKRVVPQSWNRYTYVLNNPLKYVDPSGMIWGYYDQGNKRHFCWAAGDAVCKGYSAYTGPMILDDTNYGTVRLNKNGTFTNIDAPALGKGNRLGGLSAKDAEAINAITGGALCSLSAGFACPNAGEPIADNVKTAVDVAQMVFAVKALLKAGLTLGAIASIFKKDTGDILKVIKNMSPGEINEILATQKNEIKALFGSGPTEKTIRVRKNNQGQACYFVDFD